MAELIGETKSRFYSGVLYRFVRVEPNLWYCTNREFVPGIIQDEIKSDWR